MSWLAREFNTMADSMTGLVGEVRSERERLETVINSIDDGIVVLDPRRNVVAANDAFLQRSGRLRDQMLGCVVQRARPRECALPPGSARRSGLPALRPATGAHLRAASRSTAPSRWEEVHASPIRGPQGELIQVVEVWRDITDRRAAEAHLAEAHRLASLGQLASGFSHELNTPLGTVLACVEGILRDTRAGDGDGSGVVRASPRAPGSLASRSSAAGASPSTSSACRGGRATGGRRGPAGHAAGGDEPDRAHRPRTAGSASSLGPFSRASTCGRTSPSSSTP